MIYIVFDIVVCQKLVTGPDGRQHYSDEGVRADTVLVNFIDDFDDIEHFHAFAAKSINLNNDRVVKLLNCDFLLRAKDFIFSLNPTR
jgi:hypothetical protein